MHDRCDPTLYEGDIAKYITHLIYFHEAINPKLIPMMQSKDPEVWKIINEVHTSLMEKTGLGAMAEQGYCIDQWGRWQQGMCQTYAEALIRAKPGLRLGVAGVTQDYGNGETGWWPQHFFAHDDEYAYDSAGRHPLPYHGVDGTLDHVELDVDPQAWGSVSSEEGSTALDTVDAVRHSVRNGILVGAYELRLVLSSTT